MSFVIYNQISRRCGISKKISILKRSLFVYIFINESKIVRVRKYLEYLESNVIMGLNPLQKNGLYNNKHFVLIQKTYKNLNAAGLDPAPPGNRPGALTTKPCVLAKLRRNFCTLVTTYLCCQHLCREIFTNFRYPKIITKNYRLAREKLFFKYF